MKSYIENESSQQQLARTFSNIASCLNLWKHTDIPKIERIQELSRAHDLIMIVLLSMENVNDENPFDVAITRILSKTGADICFAIEGKKMDFQQHAISFSWMSDQLRS